MTAKREDWMYLQSDGEDKVRTNILLDSQLGQVFIQLSGVILENT